MALIEPWVAHGGRQGRNYWARATSQQAAPDEDWTESNQPLIQGHQDWTDILVPRGSSIWEVNPSKLRTAAIAFTFVSTAGFVTLMAVGGLLAVMVTGAVVTFAVLAMVMACTALITLIVTGAPIGYALWRLLMPRLSSHGGGGGAFDGGHSHGMFGHSHSMFGGGHGGGMFFGGGHGFGHGSHDDGGYPQQHWDGHGDDE